KENKKINNTAKSDKQAGLTMIELGAGLVILAIIAAAIAPAIYKNMKNAEGSSAAKQTMTMMSDIHTKIRRPPYTAVTNSWAIAAKIPDANSISGTSIINYWGSAVTVASTKLTGGVNNGAVSITNPVPPDSCLTYVNEVAPMVDELVIGTTTVKTVGGKLNDATAATACDVSGATISVIMKDS
ncbi:type 4 pilus major pilin, partial [Neptunomonas phycophila]|uniref:type 4 pilus major pilin n=1 Tax=Neptunomonas phycophila TaxID=1572645 RepID=UPI003516BCBC